MTTVTKNLVFCPFCELKGKKEILGEILPDGSFSIMRFHKGETILKAENYAVICGSCKEVVFFRNRKI